MRNEIGEARFVRVRRALRLVLAVLAVTSGHASAQTPAAPQVRSTPPDTAGVARLLADAATNFRPWRIDRVVAGRRVEAGLDFFTARVPIPGANTPLLHVSLDSAKSQFTLRIGEFPGAADSVVGRAMKTWTDALESTPIATWSPTTRTESVVGWSECPGGLAGRQIWVAREGAPNQRVLTLGVAQQGGTSCRAGDFARQTTLAEAQRISPEAEIDRLTRIRMSQTRGESVSAEDAAWLAANGDRVLAAAPLWSGLPVTASMAATVREAVRKQLALATSGFASARGNARPATPTLAAYWESTLVLFGRPVLREVPRIQDLPNGTVMHGTVITAATDSTLVESARSLYQGVLTALLPGWKGAPLPQPGIFEWSECPPGRGRTVRLGVGKGGSNTILLVAVLALTPETCLPTP